jgi:hypothetical protein
MKLVQARNIALMRIAADVRALWLLQRGKATALLVYGFTDLAPALLLFVESHASARLASLYRIKPKDHADGPLRTCGPKQSPNSPQPVLHVD